MLVNTRPGRTLMTVYRVEDAHGNGPEFRKEGAYETIIRPHLPKWLLQRVMSSFDGLPIPAYSGYGARFYGTPRPSLMIADCDVCGARDLKQLAAWFKPLLTVYLKQHGFFLAEYLAYASDADCQVLFDLDSAILVKHHDLDLLIEASVDKAAYQYWYMPDDEDDEFRYRG